MSTKPVRVALISDSELILNGLRKILEYEPGIVIVAEGKGSRYLRECVLTERPDFIFLDNRDHAYDAAKLMRSRIIKEPGVKVIQFREGESTGERVPNLIDVNQETTSTELAAVSFPLAGSHCTGETKTPTTQCPRMLPCDPISAQVPGYALVRA